MTRSHSRQLPPLYLHTNTKKSNLVVQELKNQVGHVRNAFQQFTIIILKSRHVRTCTHGIIAVHPLWFLNDRFPNMNNKRHGGCGVDSTSRCIQRHVQTEMGWSAPVRACNGRYQKGCRLHCCDWNLIFCIKFMPGCLAVFENGALGCGGIYDSGPQFSATLLNNLSNK